MWYVRALRFVFILCLSAGTPAISACHKDNETPVHKGVSVQPETIHQLSPAAVEQTLPWLHDDYKAALAMAKAQTRPLVVDLWAPWCHTCVSMQKMVLTHPKITALQDRFIWLALDTDRPLNSEAVQKLSITAWPTFYVLGPDGTTLTRHVGGASVEEFVDFLKDGLAAQAGLFQEKSLGALIQTADQAATAGDHMAAEKAYRDALIAVGPEAQERFPLRVDLAASLAKQGKAADCVKLGDSTFTDQKNARSASGPDFVSWIVACVKKGNNAQDVERIVNNAIAADGPLWSVLNNPKATLSADDRSDALRILRELNDEAGNPTQAREIALQQKQVLDDAVAALDDPEAMAGYAWPREEVYVYLGQGADLVSELVRLCRQLPQSYDPPYRLAWLLNKIGKHDEARVYAKDALTKVYGPRKIRAWQLLASIEKGRKDPVAERQAWESVRREVDALPRGHRMGQMAVLADEQLARLAEKAPAAPTP